jgi:hypothetical protein
MVKNPHRLLRYCLNIGLLLISGILPGQVSTIEVVKLTFTEPLQLAADRNVQTTCRGYIVAENDSTVRFQPEFDRTAELSIQKSKIKSPQTYSKPVESVMTAEGNARPKIEVFMQPGASIRLAGLKVRSIYGNVVAISDSTITIVPVLKKTDTIEMAYQDIKRVRLFYKRKSLKEALGGAAIGTGAGLLYFAILNNSEVGLEIITHAFIATSLPVFGAIVGYVDGDIAERRKVNGDKQRYLKLVNELRAEMKKK